MNIQNSETKKGRIVLKLFIKGRGKISFLPQIEEIISILFIVVSIMVTTK
jgi:hypothetical protein